MTSKGFIPVRFSPCCMTKLVRPPTKRRLANARKAVERDKENNALFPEFVRFQSAEERLAHYDSQMRLQIRKIRDLEAKNWREFRRRLATLSDAEQIAFCERWNSSQRPGTPLYAMEMMRSMFGRQDWLEEDRRELERELEKARQEMRDRRGRTTEWVFAEAKKEGAEG